MPDGRRRHPLRRTLLRLFGGSLVVLLLATIAGATAIFEDVGIVADAIGHGVLIKTKALAPTYAGKPVTILILGSDSRSESKDSFDRSDPPHSDTIILAHLDPQSGQTTLMSVPRDLDVSYKVGGNDYPNQKINSAFTYGYESGGTAAGAATAVRVIEHLLHIKINDVIVIDFQAFAYLVNGLGCVFIDVDHLYANSDAYDGYAHIYIAPGYKPLCYYQALSYVRYRHDDSTYARDAREQDFIRQAKQQLTIRTSLLTNPGALKHLLTQVSSHGGLASNIRGSNQVLRLIEIAESSVDKPVRQVQFPDVGSMAGADGAVNQTVPPPSELSAVVHSFLYGNPYNAPELPKSSPASSGHGRHHHHHHAARSLGVPAGLTQTPSYALSDALAMQVKVPFPVEIPHLASIDGYFPGEDDFHAFREKVPDTATFAKLVYHGYRITWEYGATAGAYYGIDGISWTDPPLFANALTRTVDGRSYEFVSNGKHWQDIGWIQGKAMYWVSNTLFDDLTNAQMLAIAESAQRV
ncbi:MAG TPA: LCP family protein [Solirubrobacteraceae bacterium]|nr:LCP family protein [Solirubrobacteraceae bacterium]